MSNLTHRRRSAALTGLGAAAALALLAGCGGGHTASKDKQDKGVASIVTPSASGGSASPSADTGRPQLRLDTSDAEKERLSFIYLDCLRDHGVPGGYKPGSSQWFPGGSGGSSTKDAGAYKACLSKKPLQPPELDPATNPHYLDDFREYVRCLNAGGLKVKGLPDGSGWNYDGPVTLSESEQTDLDRRCTLKAYR